MPERILNPHGATLTRREVLKKTAIGAGVVILSANAIRADDQDLAASGGAGISVVKNVTATPGSGFYFPNREPLAAAPFQKLPPGAIEVGGWVRHQLDLQLDGLNGRMSEVSDYLDYENCGWAHPEKTGWEELPYWLRGFGDLGYVTGDARVLSLTRKWIDGILATQQADGMFGPTALRTSLDGGPDFWPGMPLLQAMRSFQEYYDDPRIVPFISRYLHFQHQQAPEVFGRSWAAFRWGDTLETIFWLYNRSGEDWLLELARKIHEHSANYTAGLPTLHNVNLAQGFREPAQFGVLGADEKLRQATYRNYESIMAQFGQFPGGGFAGDENCRRGCGDPRQGFETCGIVEFMRSFEILTRITGDPLWADRCEELAFNSLPAALDPMQKGTHYITCANVVQLDNIAKTHHQFSNDWAMLAYMPGIHNYRCCPHNYGMGWPHLAEELWLATSDGGLCALIYAPSTVKAKVANNGRGQGQTVGITTSTDYPFGEAVELVIRSPEPVEFPLYLRIPGWCDTAGAQINGTKVDVGIPSSSYLVLRRRWRNADRVTLHLPMQTRLRTWKQNKNAVSVYHGPMAFSLDIKERWETIGGTSQWPQQKVSTDSPWNYGLCLDSSGNAALEVERSNNVAAANPWTADTAPIRLRATARRVEQWSTDAEQVVEPLPSGPVNSSGEAEKISLIPMGAARLRITAFPSTTT